MTDDPHAERPSVLASLDHLDVGPAPVRDIVDAGHKIKRRRRATLAGIAAVTGLVVGGGLVTTQVLGSNQTDDSLVADKGAEKDATADVRELPVKVTMVDGGDIFERGAATWNTESRTLTYVAGLNYSSSCRPGGTATQGEDGVTLDLRVTAPVAENDDMPMPCTADSRTMVATISGLEGPPAELVVTEDGRTSSVVVSDRGAVEAVLTATPSTLMPGAEFVVDTPGVRGIGFTLTAGDGTTYYLTVVGLDGVPSWDREPPIWADIATSGPGNAITPPIAAPGTYELCTANTLQLLCTKIEVEEAASTTTTVPDVIGLPLPEAKRVLEEAGFAVVVVAQDRECPDTASCLSGVIRATPEPNSEVAPGTEVTIETWR